MSVASHLGMSPAAYDRRIRGLIPHYDELIREAADALVAADRPIRRIVDLGIGTGALARACLKAEPQARVVGNRLTVASHTSSSIVRTVVMSASALNGFWSSCRDPSRISRATSVSFAYPVM